MSANRAASSDQRLSALLEHGGSGQPAIVVAEDATSLSYAELGSNVRQLAGRLTSVGVKRGDRVVLMLPNGPELLQLVFALARIGAVAAPMNPAFTEDELEIYLNDIEPRVILLTEHEHTTARTVAHELKVVDVAVGLGAVPVLKQGTEEIEEASASYEEGTASDIARMLHTSGTTGKAKQVPLSQRNLVASARTIAAHYGLAASDLSYCVMPLYHIHGLVASAFAAFVNGGSVVISRRFTPRRFWQDLHNLRPTWFSAGPTLHHMILEKIHDADVPSSLRFVRSCSSPLSPALMARAEAAYGVPVVEAYGMTEASHQMASNPLPPARRVPGSVGVPTGTDIAIIDPERRFLPEGSFGEVVVRGPGITPGYLDNDHANVEAFSADGWFRTGDRGVIEAGYLTLDGRLKEMILRGGENISPIEIENVLLNHSAVRDAVCFGVEDDKYGEEVVAAVSLSAFATESELLVHCRRVLARFKVPRCIHIVDEIPRTSTGKLQRRQVATTIYGPRLSS